MIMCRRAVAQRGGRHNKCLGAAVLELHCEGVVETDRPSTTDINGETSCGKAGWGEDGTSSPQMSYKFDVAGRERQECTKIGEGLSANETLDATVNMMSDDARPDRPAHASTKCRCSSRALTRPTMWIDATRGALSGGTTMVVDFCPGAGPVAADGDPGARQRHGPAPPPTIPSIWRSPGGAQQVFNESKFIEWATPPTAISSWPTRAR